ncbi:MAG: GntR family transcriptional regulator [Firmicutes bacterium]|nr:GntR family transcriptional regulator [Bacillota bacterium]
MAWELDGNRSIYSQLVEVILRRIVTGVYPAGSRLDSVRDLASEAGVNPNTMQRALMELERTGMITTQRTSGKFVTENQDMIHDVKKRMANQAVDRLLAEMEKLGIEKEDVIEIIRRNSDERDNGVS